MLDLKTRQESMEPNQRIIIGAQELFYRYGIKSITMDDIAKHLGMSKKTIYQHYADKDEIVTQMVEFILINNQSEFCKIAEHSNDAILEIMETMKHMATTFSKMHPSLIYDMTKYYPEAYRKFREYKDNSILKIVETNLKKGQDAGLYRLDFETKILSRLRLEQVEMAMRQEVFPADKFNHTDVQVQLLDHFLHGICTLKGHKLLNKYKQLHEEE